MAKKSRVLILTTAYLPYVGGSELAIKNITDRLPEIYFDLITARLSKDLPAYEKIGNVNVYRVGNSFGLSPFLLPKNFFPIAVFFKARQLMRQEGKYDIIHAYQASQAAGGGWLLKWKYPHIPFLVTMQEGKELNQQSRLVRFFRYLIFKKTDAFTVISNYLAHYIRSQNLKVPIAIIPNGINPEKFNFPSSNPAALDKLKEKLGIKMDERVIVTVSRLVPKNGIRDLIGAMPETLKQIPNAKLLIIGSGKLEKNLNDQIGELNLEKNVLMIGEVENDNLPDYLLISDVFVRPSLSEGLGTAFLEAMAAGVPIIGTPVGGIADFLIDHQTGLFCRVGDSKDLADKITTLLIDKELRGNIIKNAKELALRRYNWDNIASEFKNLCLTIQSQK